MNNFNIHFIDCNIIPITGCPTKFYEIQFVGWKPTLVCDHSDFSDVQFMASECVKTFVEIYKNTHAFTEPIFYMKIDGNCGIRIGTMEIELYEEIFMTKRKTKGH